MKHSLAFLWAVAPFYIFAQCLEVGGIGSFEGASPLTTWFTADEDNGSFQIESTEVYAGTQALQIEVNTPSPWQIRMFSGAACYFDMVAGEDYTLSFQLKGPVGTSISLTLMDDLTNDATTDITLTSNDWTWYTATLTAGVSSSSGRLKLNFKEVGTYYLDELSLIREVTNWYVSPNGINDTSGDNGTSTANPLQTIQYAINNAWQPGDTICVMDGIYQNANYGSGSLNNGAVVSLNSGTVTGEATGWLVIKNAAGHSPKLQFDGSGGFMGTANYLEIAGFEIEGPNQAISYTDAFSNRLIQDNYYGGRGIAIWSGHHIYIHDNVVHDCPNSGIRINNGDYCTVDRNIVYNNTWWSSNAESAIVFATAQDIDTERIIKMRISNNLVYDNYNNIPYYNPTYPTDGPSDYGTPAQDYIIDGSGCYITRNRDTYLYGWFYFANNVSYGNGINGLVVHKSDRSIVTNNTCYLNGAVPLSSGRQASSGITIHGSDYVRLYNNISWARFDSDGAYRVYDWPNTQFLEASNNILAKGLSDLSAGQYFTANPYFVDTLNRDLRIRGISPARDAGFVHTDLPSDDYDMQLRDANPDIGAYEWFGKTVQIKVFLHGAFNGTDMNTNLQVSSLLPNQNPYTESENMPSFTNDMVDWVKLELRDASDSSSIIASRAALLRKDGQVVDLDGSLEITFDGVTVSSAYVVVRHRNHLGVMTKNPVSF